MKKHIEPERPSGVWVIDRAVTFQYRLITARIFVRRTEEGLCEIEEFIRSAHISKVNEPGEFRSVCAIPRRQHIPLMEIVMAEDRTIVLIQKIEAFRGKLLQTMSKVGVTPEIMKTGKHISECHDHIIRIRGYTSQSAFGSAYRQAFGASPRSRTRIA